MTAQLSFFGATGTVTGSRFLLETQGKKLLIDCGMFQGLKQNRLKNWEPFPVPPRDIDRIFLTHAHIDHSGYIPRLCRQGFAGRIHCTFATHNLCKILLHDSGYLQEEDARWANKKGYSKHKPALPLYTVEDAEKSLSFFEPIDYGKDLFLNDNLRVKFKVSGHILGSAFVDIKATSGETSRRFVFSGDIGKPNRPILQDPVQVHEVDYLVIESTYGDRLHGNAELSLVDELARVVNASVERGGNLIVPSFAVERSQELLFYIRQMEEQKKIPPLPVYLDSPMAIEATKVFEQMKGEYDFESKLLELEGKKILRPAGLQLTKDVKDSKMLHAVTGPAIIISASGMLEGGRILHHLEHKLPDPKHTVLFVGYQAEGTRGRAILNGAKEIKIHGQQIPVNAKIENIAGLSGHADYNEMLAWLMGFNRPPLKTFVVHGEPEASESFAGKIREKLGWDVVVPAFRETFVLD